MRSLTPNTVVKTQTQYATEPIIIVQVDWLSGTKYYSDKDILIDGRDCKGIITSCSSVTASGKQDNAGEVSSINIDLHDNGTLKAIIDTVLIEGTIATVYHYYIGTLWSDVTIVLRGKIAGPITWNEGDRLLSLAIESLINDSEIGFSLEDDTLPNTNKDSSGKPWPICFGTVLKLPAVAIYKSTTAKNIDRIYGGWPSYDEVPIVIDGGENFPQNEMLTLNIGNTLFTGYFDHNIFYRQESNLLWYTNVPIAARVAGDEDEGNESVCWITGNYNLAGKHVYGGTTKNYCKQQEGNKCFFKYPWGVQLASGTFTEVRGCVHQSWYADPTSLINWYIHENQFVMQWNLGYNELHIINLVPSNEILGVYASRTLNSVTSLTPVPSSYYTIHNPLAIAGQNVTAIEFTTPLESREAENWDGQIYVSLRSSLNTNVADCIKWLTEQYTDYICDSTFDDVRLKVNPYPVNFALLEQGDYLSIVEKIAWQARCAIFIRNGVVSIIYLSELPVSIYSISEIDVLFKTLRLSFTDTNSIITKMIGKYQKDYTGDSEHELIYRNNIDIFGTKDREDDFNIYWHEELVKMSLYFWGYRYSNSWRTIALTALLRALKIEPYDAVIFGLVKLSTNHITGVIEQSALNSDIHEIELEALLASKAGDSISGQPVEDPNFWTGDPSYPVQAIALTDPGEGLTQVDYAVQVTDTNKKTNESPDAATPQTYSYGIMLNYEGTNKPDEIERGQNFNVAIQLFNSQDVAMTTDGVDVVISLHCDDADDKFTINGQIDYPVTLTNGMWVGTLMIDGGSGTDQANISVHDADDRENYENGQTDYFNLIDLKIDTLTWTTQPPASITRGELFMIALEGTGTANEDIAIELANVAANDKIYRADGSPLTKVTLITGNWNGLVYIDGGTGSTVGSSIKAVDKYNQKYTTLSTTSFTIAGYSIIKITQTLSLSQRNDTNLNNLVIDLIGGSYGYGEQFQLNIHLHDSIGNIIPYNCTVQIIMNDANGALISWLLPEAGILLVEQMINGEALGPLIDCQADIQSYHVSPATIYAKLDYYGTEISGQLTLNFAKQQNIIQTLDLTQVMDMQAQAAKLLNQLISFEQVLNYVQINNSPEYQYIQQVLPVSQELRQIVIHTRSIIQEISMSQYTKIQNETLRQDLTLTQEVLYKIEHIASLIQTLVPSQNLTASAATYTSLRVTPSAYSIYNNSDSKFDLLVEAIDQYGNISDITGSVTLTLVEKWTLAAVAPTLSIGSISIINGTGSITDIYISGGQNYTDYDVSIKATYDGKTGYGPIYSMATINRLGNLVRAQYYATGNRFEPGDVDIEDDWNEVETQIIADCAADTVAQNFGPAPSNDRPTAIRRMANNIYGYVAMNGEEIRGFGDFAITDTMRRNLVAAYVNVFSTNYGNPTTQNGNFYWKIVNIAPTAGSQITTSGGTLIPTGTTTRQSFDISLLDGPGLRHKYVTVCTNDFLTYVYGLFGRCIKQIEGGLSSIASGVPPMELEHKGINGLDILRIKDYTDNYFNLGGCGCAPSGAAAWDGKWYSSDGINYRRQLTTQGTYQQNTSMSGYLLTNTIQFMRMYYTGTQWLLYIYCSDGGSDYRIWYGNKGGNSAEGTYNRQDGCSTKATVTIESVRELTNPIVMINGYTDTFFNPCGFCLNTPLLTAWDGKFYAISSTQYLRQLDYDGNNYTSGKKLNGKGLTNIVVYHQLYFDGTMWTLSIYCSDGVDDYVLWEGENWTTDIIGMYDYTSGCANEVPALVIVTP